MKQNYEVSVVIPDGMSCNLSDNVLQCSKGNIQISKFFKVPNLVFVVSEKEILVKCVKANKKNRASVNSCSTHISNMFKGIDKNFVYELEICNVHFPMTVKLENNKLVINNFLGEKVNRSANILSGVEVKIKDNKIEVSSAEIESAGQTAANIEKASKVTGKDRRIFQDGIFITKKPRREL
ncbi:50S ribosomal protein L6 [Candidatus Pacearchaeota archaeon]|nr:50S ribosomal protein L6 [Candidatus Pacearchaeota archaeon]